MPLVCSGGLIGNDRCFVTSEECAKVIKRNWDDKNGLVNDPVYAKVGGELIMTNNCVMSPKVGDGDSIAVCGLGAAVNPQTVLVPCYPDSEVQSGEVLLSESQTNLNNGKMEEKFQSTWLPTHNDIGMVTFIKNVLRIQEYFGIQKVNTLYNALQDLITHLQGAPNV